MGQFERYLGRYLNGCALHYSLSSMTGKMFCDEFGNTGGRLRTPEQTVLVYAFMLLQPEA